MHLKACWHREIQHCTEETLSYQMRRALCICEVWNEEGIVRARKSEGRTSSLQPLTCRHTLQWWTCSPACFDLVLSFELYQLVGIWVITGLGCNGKVASSMSVQIKVKYKYLSARKPGQQVMCLRENWTEPQVRAFSPPYKIRVLGPGLKTKTYQKKQDFLLPRTIA